MCVTPHVYLSGIGVLVLSTQNKGLAFKQKCLNYSIIFKFLMEGFMSEKKVIHEVKLQKSVIIILAVLAFGVCANVLVPSISPTAALADFESGTLKIRHSGSVTVY